MRVVVGADPCKTKLQYTPVAKIKNILLIPSAHLLYSRPLTLSRRRRPRLLRKSVNSHFFSAGVQTMRARICSAFSCDMFARVVWLRLRMIAKPPTFISLLCRTHLPRMARATDSCTPPVVARRTAQVLLADFWYFWSRKSTRKRKLLYVFSRETNGLPYHSGSSMAPTPTR